MCIDRIVLHNGDFIEYTGCAPLYYTGWINLVWSQALVRVPSCKHPNIFVMNHNAHIAVSSQSSDLTQCLACVECGVCVMLGISMLF